MNRGSIITYAPGAQVDSRYTPSDLGPRLLAYTHRVDDLDKPEDVLDGLHAVTSTAFDLRVLGAFRIPRKLADWDSMRVGQTVFLHQTAPKGWWEEWFTFAQHNNPIGYMMFKASLAPFTWSEAQQLMQTTAMDRAGFDLFLKYDMRDGLACPVGGRWVVMFWARKVLSKRLTQTARIMIFTAASFTAMRLEQMVGAITDSGGLLPRLTPRELAVLRLTAMGKPDKEVANQLALGDETVRTHMKKAQAKLGARNRTHAVAEALRHHFIA